LIVEHTEQKIKIDWQFSIQTARSKLNSHYVAVQSANKKFKDTYFTMYLVYDVIRP
jgi:hypothetical protein